MGHPVACRLAYDFDRIGPPLFAPAISLWMAFCGGLMVARFATPSFKKISFKTDAVSFVVLGFVVLVAALLTYPWQTLALVDATYLVVILASLLRRKPKTA